MVKAAEEEEEEVLVLGVRPGVGLAVQVRHLYRLSKTLISRIGELFKHRGRKFFGAGMPLFL